MDPSELTIPTSARGAKGPKSAIPVDITVVRPLTTDDLELLVRPPPVGFQAPTVKSLRATHHQLAQLLVRGVPETEASLITGYSLSRISILKGDPTFSELLANYGAQRELAFADALERMRTLGLSALDELQERLENDPSGWTNREMMEMAELMLIKPRQATGPSGGFSPSPGNPPVTVNVKFVSSETPALTIDGKPDAPTPDTSQ